MTKEQLIHRLGEINASIESLKKQEKEVYRSLINNFCPHKVGQKAKYTRILTKRTGGIFNPKYEKVGERIEILVCVGVSASVYKDTEYFRYSFKRLRSNGTLTERYVHLSMDDIKNDVEWLDEFYTEPK